MLMSRISRMEDQSFGSSNAKLNRRKVLRPAYWWLLVAEICLGCSTAYSSERGSSVRFDAFRISMPTMFP